jgi:glycosyltransferase involved in cell wall biosynthesis
MPKTRLRLHVVSLPHTQTTKAYSTCAYTQKIRKFCNMMHDLGHEVYLYASEDNEARVSELVSCISKKQQKTLGFAGPEDYLKIAFDAEEPIWQTFNLSVILELGKRLKPGDIICVISGEPVHDIATTFRSNLTVEIGVGYENVLPKGYRVFESYAWMHTMYGKLYTASAADGQFYDAVIPNYFEVEDFPLSLKKDDYFLYLGRLTRRKGWQIAQMVCEQLGKRLVVAGPGEFFGYGEYVGIVGPKQRAKLLSHAQAVFVPTIYIGPFEGVSIEANLCGTPVITSDWGSFTENVINGFNGYRCRTYEQYFERLAAHQRGVVSPLDNL